MSLITEITKGLDALSQLKEWPNEYFCQLCIRNLETTSHLFHACNFSRMVWDTVSIWTRVMDLKRTNWGCIDDMEQWFVDMGNNNDNAKRDGICSVVILTI